jgi:hypothetical protein
MFGKTMLCLARHVPRKLRKPRTIKATSYGIFLKKVKNNSALKGLRIEKRAHKSAAMWNALSDEKKAAFKKASKGVVFTYIPKQRRTKKRPSPFARFVRANIHKVIRVKPDRRFATLAKMFRAKQ